VSADPNRRATPVQPTDEQLALACMQGDAEAFRLLVERLRSPMIGYLVGLGCGWHEAEELAQSTFLVAWQKISGLRKPDRVGRWLFRLAHNLAVKRGRRVRTVPLEEDPPERAQPGGDPRLIPLMEAVARLSEPHREVIIRKHFGRFRGKEIARQLGVAPGTVRSRLARAYAELRAVLQEQLQTED
jgi:RNA polymerase sigma-70 factor (ECF subfamily)